MTYLTAPAQPLLLPARCTTSLAATKAWLDAQRAERERKANIEALRRANRAHIPAILALARQRRLDEWEAA